MDLKKFKGIMPALLTAFGEDGINRRQVGTLVRFLAGKGVHGFYVACSSGEMLLMSVSERKRLLETVIEELPDKNALAVIAHVGCADTAGGIELAVHADKAGADAVSSVTPFYFKYSFEEIKHYYERLACVSALPVIIYNIPSRTGLSLTNEQLHELLTIENVCGMKFTSSDFFQLQRLKAEHPDKVFFNGFDEMLLPGLTAGADGGIGTTYNFMPGHILNIYNAFRSGDMSKALAEQDAVNRVIETIVKLGVIESSKALLSLIGIDYGICREPFLPLSRQAIGILEDQVLPLIV